MSRRPGSPLFRSYVALGAFLVVCLVVTIAKIGPDWVRELAPNLVAEVVGILLVVALVDQVLRKRDETDRIRRRAQGLGQLRIPLKAHAEMLLNMHWNAQGRTGLLPASESDRDRFKAPGFVTKLCELDFSTDAPVLPRANWLTHAASGFRALEAALARTLDVYGTYLNVEDAELIEGLRAAFLPKLVGQSLVLPQVDAQLGVRRNYAILGELGQLVQDYVDQVCEMMTRVDEAVGERAQSHGIQSS